MNNEKIEICYDAKYGVAIRNQPRPKAQNTYKTPPEKEDEEDPSGWNWVLLVTLLVGLAFWLFS